VPLELSPTASSACCSTLQILATLPIVQSLVLELYKVHSVSVLLLPIHIGVTLLRVMVR
jgi:hypothetical protein